MKFIRLSKWLINPAAIRSITFSDTQYKIAFTTERVKGYILFGSGATDSSELEYIIDKKENPSDYRVMEHWISRNESF